MSLAFTGKKTEGYREKMMEWKRLFLEHQTLWVDRCLLRDLWLWLCPPAMYSSIWKESSRSSCKLFMCGCLLSIMKEKNKRKMFHHVFAVGLVLCNHQYHNLSVILFSCQPCFLLYYSISDVQSCIWFGYMCEEEFLRVSTGRCFIFVMKYIMHTYIQAGIMFSFCCSWMSIFNPSGRGGGGGCKKIRSGVKVGACVCVCHSCEQDKRWG